MNSLEGIYLSGEIGKRAGRNQERFFQPDFWPDQEKAFRNPDYEWPGDNEGRLLLAHILLERCTHRTSRELPVILDKILRKMNSQGYYGPVIGDGFISEQQAAGNSWILRGLTEYYLWKKEQTVLEAIKRLVHGYLYELEKNMDTYPMGPEVMNYKGEAEGCLIPEPFGKWYMSTDFGCLFILLDGATAALEILQDSRLENFVRKLIGKFGQLDPEKYHLQTHATLSAARGRIRV